MALFYGEASPIGIMLLSLTLRRKSLSAMKGFFRYFWIRTRSAGRGSNTIIADYCKGMWDAINPSLSA